MTEAGESKVTRPTAEAGAVEPVVWQWRGHIRHNDNWYQWVSVLSESVAKAEADAYSRGGYCKAETRALYDQSAIDTLRAQLEAAERFAANEGALRMAAEARAEAAEAEVARLDALEERWRLIAAKNGVTTFTGNCHALFANELRAARTKEAAP